MDKTVKMRGIDLSHWNNVKNWDEVAKHNDFVMLKLGGEENGRGSFRQDVRFFRHYEEATKRGMHIGCYFFMGKRNMICADPKESVEWVLSHVKGLELDMPIALDFENQSSSLKTLNTEYVKSWCSLMEEGGYYVAIYASEISGFKDCLIAEELTAYDKWVARYRTREPDMDCGMWQYTSTGSVSGILGDVDCNVSFKDYPTIIRSHGLNFVH